MTRAGEVAPGPGPRVLHVVASLGIGGIETWLVHMFRQRQNFSVQHEVLLTKDEVGAYEPEVRALGIPIHRLPLTGGKAAWLVWLTKLRRFLVGKGPYAIIHSHLSLFNAPIVAAAWGAGVPVRFAHCHDARSQGTDFQRAMHKLLRATCIWVMKRAATDRIGISEAAIEEIAGKEWRRDARARVLLYGFDFSRAEGAGERSRVLREKIGIGGDRPVIGHVGRLDPVKNHELLLRAFALLRRRAPNARLVLVGEGPLLEQLRARAAELGIANGVHFSGPTNDVPAYMALFDLLTLPSFSEGLGIVCLEAQAAGTRSLVSQTVPKEVAILPGGVEHLSLDAGPEGWAEAIERLVTLPAPDPEEWRRAVEASRFGIRRCVDELDCLYQAGIARAR